MERFTLLKSDFLRLPTERWHMVEIMPIVIFRSEIPYKESTRAITGQRGSLSVMPLGYLNFKKVIFRTMQTMRKTVFGKLVDFQKIQRAKARRCQ